MQEWAQLERNRQGTVTGLDEGGGKKGGGSGDSEDKGFFGKFRKTLFDDKDDKEDSQKTGNV